MNTRRKIKKHFQQHPVELNSLREEVRNFSDHMDDIIKDEDIPSFYEFLARKNNIALYFHKGDQGQEDTISKPLYSKFKIIIPITIAIILCLFMVFTPVGHAIAKSIYNTFVQWFGNEVTIHHRPGDAPPEIPIITTGNFDTFSDIQTKIDVNIAFNDRAELTGQIEVVQDDPTFIKIKSKYTIDFRLFIVTQTSFLSDTDFGATVQFDDGQAIDETLENSMRFIGGIRSDLGFVVAYMENTMIEIRAEETDYDSFINFIHGIHYE